MFIPTRSIHLASRIAFVVFFATPFLPAISNDAWADPLPTNNDPANQIRFHTPAEADAKRSQLVKFIWSNGLPAALPTLTSNVSLPSQAVGIEVKKRVSGTNGTAA